MAAVSTAIEANQPQSIINLSKKFSFPETSMWRLIHHGFNTESRGTPGDALHPSDQGDLLYQEGNFVFQQDGAPSHNANATQVKLTEEFDGPDHFWRKEIWPLRSPDLNPLDYNVSSVLQDKVQATSHPNLESLKACNVAIWEAL